MLKKGAFTAGAVALAALALFPIVLRGPRPIPDVATDFMEPQVAERIRSARKRVAASPASGQAWGSLGMVFQAHSLDSEAEPCYAEAFRLDERDFRWPYLLARILKSRDPERALGAIDQARRLKADYAPIHLLEAELLETRGDADSAMASYRRALSVEGGSAAAEFGIGRLALAKDNLEESTKHLERATGLAPDSGSIHAVLSQLYHRLGRDDEAREEERRARRLHPDVEVLDPVLASVLEADESIHGYQARAIDAERAGDPSRAEALLRRAIEIRPGDASLHYNLGNHLSRQGRLPEAEESYRHALTIDGQHVPTLVNLGILASENGDVEKGARLFRQALEREPSHAGALLGIGNVAAAQDRLDDAVRWFERALESDPARPDAHYALARALAARGAIDDAIEHFLKASEGAPERGDIHVHLTALYAAREDEEQANHHMRRARELGIAFPDPLLPGAKRPFNQPD